MVTKAQLEDIVQRLIMSAKAGGPVEDSFVELKAQVPRDLGRAAKQLGGHANASAGHPVIWILGVDESGNVWGAKRKEVVSWYPRLAAQFDGPAPRFSKCCNVAVAGSSVAAIVFSTDEPPYVIRKADGTTEVPWRVGDFTSTASRDDLLGLLSRYAHVPEAQVLSAELSATDRDAGDWYVILSLRMYLKPRTRRPVTIPLHECSGSFLLCGAKEAVQFWEIGISEAGAQYRRYRSSDFVLKRPMAIDVQTWAPFPGSIAARTPRLTSPSRLRERTVPSPTPTPWACSDGPSLGRESGR